MEVVEINFSMWIIIILIFCIIISRNKKFVLNNIVRKRKGRKRRMPTEMIKEFIGKVCCISLFNESFGITGKIISVEENWLKVQERDSVRMVNGDMIRDIKIMPSKYQK